MSSSLKLNGGLFIYDLGRSLLKMQSIPRNHDTQGHDSADRGCAKAARMMTVSKPWPSRVGATRPGLQQIGGLRCSGRARVAVVEAAEMRDGAGPSPRIRTCSHGARASVVRGFVLSSWLGPVVPEVHSRLLSRHGVVSSGMRTEYRRAPTGTLDSCTNAVQGEEGRGVVAEDELLRMPSDRLR